MVGSTARKEVRLFSGCERPRCRFIRCGEREQDLALHGAAMAASEIIKHESEAAPPWTLLHWRNRLAFREPAGCAGALVLAAGSAESGPRGLGEKSRGDFPWSRRSRAPVLWVVIRGSAGVASSGSRSSADARASILQSHFRRGRFRKSLLTPIRQVSHRHFAVGDVMVDMLGYQSVAGLI